MTWGVGGKGMLGSFNGSIAGYYFLLGSSFFADAYTVVAFLADVGLVSFEGCSTFLRLRSL